MPGRDQLSTLITKVWDLRIHLRNSSPADPILIEMLWHVFHKELGSQLAQSGTANYNTTKGHSGPTEQTPKLDGVWNGGLRTNLLF